MLEIRNISVGYGGVNVLTDVTVSVSEGIIVSLLGANGAGKTTLLRVLSGLMQPEQGSIEFRNEKLVGLRADQIAERGLIQVPQGRRLFNGLTVFDNLLLGNTPKRASGKRKLLLERAFSIFPILAERSKQTAGTLSGGQQQMLAIGRALMGDPYLLVLDEPSIGLSPSVTDEVLQNLVKLNAEGMTVLLVEQNVGQALSISSTGYIIENGTIALSGDANSLRENDNVRRAYLGV